MSSELIGSGVFFLTSALLPILRKSNSPSVINIASIAGLANQRATGSIMYGVSKVSLEIKSLIDNQEISLYVGCYYPPWYSHGWSIITVNLYLILPISTKAWLKTCRFQIRVNTICPGIFPTEMTGAVGGASMNDMSHRASLRAPMSKSCSLLISSLRCMAFPETP